MTTSAELQQQIIRVLRDEPQGLDQFQVAASLGDAAFRVRAELKELKRRRVVRDRFCGASVLWALTDRGLAHAYDADQTRIGSW